jgi:hypothetical protein
MSMLRVYFDECIKIIFNKISRHILIILNIFIRFII